MEFDVGMLVDACNLSLYIGGMVLWWAHVAEMESRKLKPYKEIDFSKMDWKTDNLDNLMSGLLDQAFALTIHAISISGRVIYLRYITDA